MMRTLSGAALCVAAIGCQDLIGSDVSPPPDPGEDDGFRATGEVVVGAIGPDPNGTTAVFWPVFASNPDDDTVVLFGRGSADASGFTVTVDGRPPPEAFALDAADAPAVAVGFVFAFPASTTLPADGLVGDFDTLLAESYAATPRYSIVFEEVADDPRQPWEGDLEPGFHCAVCAEAPSRDAPEGWRATGCSTLELETGESESHPFCDFFLDQ